MIIVIEGPDNAGKTTLSLWLAKQLKAILIKNEDVPIRDPAHLYSLVGLGLAAQAIAPHVIFDRHPAISEPIYGGILRGKSTIDSSRQSISYTFIDVIIYCRPPSYVIKKSFLQRDQKSGVLDHLDDIIEAYDLWSSSIPEEILFIQYNFMGGWNRDSVLNRIRGHRT